MTNKIYINLILLCLLLSACKPKQQEATEGIAFQLNPHHGWGILATDGTCLVKEGTFRYPPTSVVGGMFAVPDSTGRWMIHSIQHPAMPVCPRSFARIGHFFEDTAPAQETPYSPILLIDKQGNTLFSSNQYPAYDIVYLHNFSEGRALIATSNGKYGYLDTQGRMVIPPIYDRAFDFSEGWALVGTANPQGDMAYQLIDTEGKIQQVIKQSSVLTDKGFSDGLLQMKHLDTHLFSYLNKEGKSQLYLPQGIIHATAFHHGRAVFQTSSGMGVINPQGKIIIPAQYQQILPASNKHLYVQQHGKWAIFTSQGQPLTDFRFDHVSSFFPSEKAIARIGQNWQWINAQGIPEGPTFTMLKDDPTARQEHTQIFLQEIPHPQTMHNAPAAQDTTSVKVVKAKNHSVPVAVPHTNTLSDNNWKKISRQSPFFAEAQKVLAGNLQENDAKRRTLILNYVEHLRTSYTTKDIDFLEQLFSEDALIIVGKVIHNAQRPEGGYLTPDQVMYNVKSKRQYLERLKAVFKANQHIDLKFSQFHIMRHPTHHSVYGVSLRQAYTSDLYSDDGYLFLLWDFTDESAPQIHVRTWQPRMLDANTPLPEEDIFNISNFNLQ